MIYFKKIAATKNMIPYSINGAVYPPIWYKIDPTTGAIVNPSPAAISSEAITSV
jgi:hypothetical protein